MNAYDMASNKCKVYSAGNYRLSIMPTEHTSIDHGYQLELCVNEGITPPVIMTIEMMLSMRVGSHKSLILHHPKVLLPEYLDAVKMNAIWGAIMNLRNIKAFSNNRLICADIWEQPNIDEMVEGILEAVIGK